MKPHRSVGAPYSPVNAQTRIRRYNEFATQQFYPLDPVGKEMNVKQETTFGFTHIASFVQGHPIPVRSSRVSGGLQKGVSSPHKITTYPARTRMIGANPFNFNMNRSK